MIEVARQVDMDVTKTALHFGWPIWKAQAAFNYYEAFPQEIDGAIAENQAMGYEKLRRLFPHMMLTEVVLSVDDENIGQSTAEIDPGKSDVHTGAEKDVLTDTTKASQ